MVPRLTQKKGGSGHAERNFWTLVCGEHDQEEVRDRGDKITHTTHNHVGPSSIESALPRRNQGGLPVRIAPASHPQWPNRVLTATTNSPNFTVTFIRTPRMPASFAKFIVPLNMNKLDLRDYLYHAYNVRVVSVRSYIEQQKVTQGKPNAPKMQIKRWFRPRAIKKMTVELESPFVWPSTPTKEQLNEQWSKDTHEQARKDNDRYAEMRGRLADAAVDRGERISMREQAKALLERREQWKPAEELGFARK